jgi:alkanesulfonate monooxygenase SsuD/methylene tetrahydromethanopterin reductase-like flavin-dependent oxidoreductase (luciferase family)
MVRPTRKEAQDYHHYIVHEQGDWEAADYAFKLRGSRLNDWLKADEDKLKARLISGAGFPCVGSYDDAVAVFQQLSGAGLDGLALGMINYVNDFPGIRDELLPRMERAGLRQPSVAPTIRAAE